MGGILDVSELSEALRSTETHTSSQKELMVESSLEHSSPAPQPGVLSAKSLFFLDEILTFPFRKYYCSSFSRQV